MKSLKLFNVVLAKSNKSNDIYISNDGYVIESSAMWAKDSIIAFYKQEKLSGNDLNKTFYKSFDKVLKSSRVDILMDQILHYLSTYGSNFQDEVYIPNDVLEIPDVKLKYKVIKGVSVKELQEKCLNMLRSGIALSEDTINDLLFVLTNDTKYKFTGDEGIRNKEAVIKIADLYGVYPSNTVEFFRYCIYRATNKSLLIKNSSMVYEIKSSTFNPGVLFENHGLEKLAKIFNRFKPLFLAFKTKCPNVINRISKLSKSMHEPLAQNALSLATQRKLTKNDLHWLNNATPFAFFKALNAVYTRMQGQKVFNYHVRNGKSFCKENQKRDSLLMMENFNFLLTFAKQKWNLKDVKFFLPKDVSYAIPTSEKMFVGNIPVGTKFYGDGLCAGIYWENAWGARDLDLSACAVGVKIGWDASFSRGDGSLIYSGDITDAFDGAVEYMHCAKIKTPYILQVNVFRGNNISGYKIIVGQSNTNIKRKYMMNPNNLIMEVKTESVQNQMIIGMFIPEENDRQSFVLLNTGSGERRVSSSSSSANRLQALYEQYNNPLSFQQLITALGGIIVNNPDDADYNFSLSELTKDSFTKLFSGVSQ